MPVGLVCEVNPYDEVQLELGVHIPRNWKKRKFLVYYRPLSVPKYFNCLDLYAWKSLAWNKSVLGSSVGVCIAYFKK